ncbi:MAG: hypothetical protein KDN20_15615, partial [Verrucomicrobiae bacterium]|nr:hypothetical protein [Verrucomicrobiae bacterium]
MITRNIASTLLLLILLAPPLHAIITGSAEEEPITIDSRASSKASTALAETAGQVKALVDAVKSGSGDLLSPSSKATNSLAAAEAAVKHEGVSVSGLKRKSWQAENAWRSRVTDVLYEFENHMTTTKKLSEDTVNSELKPFGLGKFLTTEISPGGGNVGGGISFGKEWKLEFIKSDDYNVRIVDSKFATAFFERFQYRPWHDPNSNIQAFKPSCDRPDP